MYLLLISFPLLSFLFCIFLGRKIGEKGSVYLSVTLLGLCFSISFLLFWDGFVYNSLTYFYIFTWFDLGLLSCKFSFQFDSVVNSMLLLVLGVSSLVHLFSSSYMSGDPHLPRFMGYLSLFTFFMVILVTSGNLVQLFIGWEGVGLCSYLLINFWFTRIQANKSAIKAMVLNKIGDIGVLLALSLLWKFSGSLQYTSLFSISNIINNSFIQELCSFLLILGVIGKSAQIGLHTWLPDAMEGPTPVSALIHAATMVTAGVFLIIRLSPLFESTPSISILIVLLGSFTAFFSSTIGLTQNDFKKVIAYSTCSQLGYMVMICGFSQYNLGLFHLVNHGFFKALLFLSAGSIIHSILDEQDLRKAGSIIISLPFTYSCIFIGSLSLMGLPFLTGFYSKDLIIEMMYGSHILSFALWLGIVSASITAFYSFRLLYYTFLSEGQGFPKSTKSIHESDWSLLIPLFILGLLSIIIGYFLQYFILTDQFPIILFNTVKFSTLTVSLIGAISSLILGLLVLKLWNLIRIKSWQKWYSFTNGAWYFDKIISNYIINPFFALGFNIFYKLLDNQLLEWWGPSITSNIIINQTQITSHYHKGYIHTYLFMFITFIFCFIYQL